MNVVFEKLSQNIAAGIKWDIGIAGAYLRLSACQWPCTVLIYKQGRVVGQMNNMLAGDYVETEFDAISILNGATAQVIDVQISGGGAGSNRVLGEVSVINGELNRVRAGVAFIGLSGLNGVAGQYSHSQIWNPVGSGKDLILNKASINTASTGAVIIAKATAALATLQAASSISKKLNMPVGVAEMRNVTAAAVQGVYIGSLAATANDGREFGLSEPLIIPPGYGVNFVCNTLAGSMFTTWQWIEEAV